MRQSKKEVQKSIRFPRPLIQRLERLAKKEDRPLASYLRRVLETHAEQAEKAA